MAAAEEQTRLQIGHVLFIDIVGYSKLLVNQQSELLRELNEVVSSTNEFHEAEAEGKLIRLPTGDGMALVFRTDPEAAAQCALEIARALKEHPRIALRMGIHSGPVNEVVDVNQRQNIAGAGINMAQRVMDCGDAGHILVSKHVAEDLEQHDRWRPLLHDLGTCEVKHGMRVGVVNLYADQVGNPQLPKKFQALKKHSARMRWAAIAALLALAAVIAGFFFFLRRPVRPAMAGKSIAMLPFENLSRDPDNAYFATGIQDEILTRLAKIGALKVISRNSTLQYAARPGNLSEIARQLGVVNILEGSVQKAGDQVHINVQLIRAATDEHLWAESYTRKLENIFGVEGEVATAVAEALKAKLTGAEQQALKQKPTNNPEAYDAYLRGLAYSLRPGYYAADNLNAIKHLSEAVKLDPKFSLAWAWLARENALGYFNMIGSDVGRLRDAAKRAAETAIELQPDLAEAYLAQGYSQYYCDSDYGSAISSFEKAGQLSPSNNQVPEALALVCRRLGEWQRSLNYFQQATQLDPRDAALLSYEEETFEILRQYPAALKANDQILDILPGNSDALASNASIHQAQGNLASAAALLSSLAPHPNPYVFRLQIMQLTYERRYAEGIAALQKAVTRPDLALDEYDKIDIEASLALFQQFAGDAAAARSTWQHVRVAIEAMLPNKREDFAFFELALANVALGDTAKAFTIIERNAALHSNDAMKTTYILVGRATIAVQAGEKDLAIQQLAISAQGPIGVNYGDLKLNPIWDPLRGDPRFEKIVASLAPK